MRTMSTVAALVAASALLLAGCNDPQNTPLGTTTTVFNGEPTEAATPGDAPSEANAPGPADPTTTTGHGGTTTTTAPPAAGLPMPPNADHVIGSTAHTDGKHVALTFDDGPNPAWTPQVLELLAQYHARATFCLIGNNAKAHPDLVRQIVAAGHAMCDHTMTHDERLAGKPAAVIEREIAGARQAILDAAPNASVMYFRAPGGNFSRRGAAVSMQKTAVALGMQPVAWSIDTRDWTRPGTNAIIDSVQKHLGPHDVVLMHDGGSERSQTVAALRVLLPWLVSQGYEFDLPA